MKINKSLVFGGVLLAIIGTIHFLNFWPAIGIFALNFGLGMKVAGAKTFAKAVIKVGGKKAILGATGGMLLKRHVIDLFSKAFGDVSVKKYKNNMVAVFKMKYNQMMESSGMAKIKAIGTMLLSVPILYFVWTKVLAAGLQKLVYALVYPLALGIWTFLVNSLGFISTTISFIFQVLILNFGINFLDRFHWGRVVLHWIDQAISFFGDIFVYLNKAFILIGFDPIHYVSKKSIQFNRWLETILDKGLNKQQRVHARRERHNTSREKLLIKRATYCLKKKVKQKSYWKKVKTLFKAKFLKQTTYKQKREKRSEKRKSRRTAKQTRIRG